MLKAIITATIKFSDGNKDIPQFEQIPLEFGGYVVQFQYLGFGGWRMGFGGCMAQIPAV